MLAVVATDAAIAVPLDRNSFDNQRLGLAAATWKGGCNAQVVRDQQAHSGRTAVEISGSIRTESGFSLVEAVVATGLLAGAVAFLGQMFAISVASHSSARAGTFAAVLAAQKLEQLRGLTWSVGTVGEPVSDLSTNLALPVQSPNGGPGLSHSPPNSLETNVDGYVDYVDQFGRILGGGPTVPGPAVFIRRWSVEPLAADPADTLVLRVVVKPRNQGTAGRRQGGVVRVPGEARLTTVKTRRRG